MISEARIQKQIIDWWHLASRGYRLDARLLFHTPNGGKRSKIEAAIFKGMGVRAGFPDLGLLVPRGDKHGLFLELKSAFGNLTDSQKEMLPLIEAQGFATVVCWSFEEAVSAICNYLKSGEPLLKK